MTSRKNIPWRRIAAAAFLATALGAAACETPRPDPVAPLPLRTPVTSAEEQSERSAEFTEQRARCTPKGGAGCQIAVIVQSSDGKELARYAGEIPVAHVPEAGVAKIRVEEGACGENSCSLIWITLKPDVSLKKTPLLSDKIAATREPLVELEKTRELPIDASAVPLAAKRALTRDPLVEIAKQNGAQVSARIIERDGEKLAEGEGVVSWPPRIVLRNGNVPQDPPNVLVVAKNGTELRRILSSQFRPGASSPLDEIRTDDIESIEVQKGGTCAPLGCPLIHITLKAGREGAYRKR